MPADLAQILVPFGFTSLESEIYTFLLQESPATGYRVAQAISKAAANTYKAIESLQQKGAILVEEGSSRACRAVPADELLARLTRDFEWRRAEAELALSRLGSDSADDKVYALRSRAQVNEKARHMIGAARSVVLIACSGPVASQVGDSLTASASRKVSTFLACPESLDLEGVQTAKAAPALNDVRLVVDGSELLIALFGKGGQVTQATWSRSPYLSVVQHSGLAAELSLLGLRPPPAAATAGYAKVYG